MLISALLLLLNTPLLPPSLQAQAFTSHPIDQMTSQCTAQDYSTQGMMACYQTAHDDWDRELNRVYRILIRTLADDERTLLRQAQRRWIAYRDAEYQLMRSLYGSLAGNTWTLVIAYEETVIVRERVLELQNYLDTLQFEQLSQPHGSRLEK